MTSKYPQILFIVALIAALAGFGAAPSFSGDKTGMQVAKAYGIAEFEKVEAIRYTFNVAVGSKSVRRSWVWEPKIDRVVYLENGRQVAYDRKTLSDSAEVRSIDAKFINDQYWLLFPFHLVWDDGITVVDAGSAALPIGPGKARRIEVSYPKGIGYTPGDVYELFLGDNFRLNEWIYRRGGAPEPTRVTTWEYHRRVGPLVLSLEHRGQDGGFRLWFSEVAVQIAGSSRWIEPNTK